MYQTSFKFIVCLGGHGFNFLACLILLLFFLFQITTCIHNLFSSGADRWADLYGECQIRCQVNNTQSLSCKLEFLKASGYWTAGKKHEVIGTINGNKGNTINKCHPIG